MNTPRIIETRRFYDENQLAIVLDSSNVYLTEIIEPEAEQCTQRFGLYALGGRDLIAILTIEPVIKGAHPEGGRKTD